MVEPPLDDVVRDDDLLIPVGEETVAATRFGPAAPDGPLPAILVYTPYRKDDLSGLKDDTLVRYLAGAGYHVVNADVVGTGASSGVKPEPFQATEGAEAAAIVRWLADREWTTGRIGMTGMSYPGMTALRGAIEDPDPLEAIVPVMAPFSMYEPPEVVSDSHFAGGTLSYQGGTTWLPLMQALQSLPPSRRDDAGRWAEIWRERLDRLADARPWLFQYLDHESPKDDYWRDKDISPAAVAEIDVPTFLVDGWRDSFVHANTAYFERIDAPKRLLLGPWRHTRPQEGRETRIDFRPQVVEWFDRFLKDEDNGALERPTVAYWTERRGGGTADGVWRGSERWPPAASTPTTFALSADGLARDPGATDPVEREYEADYTVGLDSTARYGPPQDTAGDDARSSCFETRLDRPFELTGPGEAELRIVPRTSDPFLAVRLVDVQPDGSTSLVTYGYLRASHRNGHGDPEPLVPGEPTAVRVPLKPTSHVFEEGHRLRVALSASLFPVALPPRGAGGFTVASDPHDPSTVTLRGRDHAPAVAFDDAVRMGDPDDRIPPTSPSVRATSSLETAREHTDDVGTFRRTTDATYDLPDGGTMRHDQSATGTVAADDPLSATFRGENRVVLDRRTERIEVRQTSRVTRDASHLTVRVSVDDEVVFDAAWRR
jgi:hypothetical protein